MGRRDEVSIVGNRFIVDAHPSVRHHLLTIPGSSKRKSGEVTLPLNLISWFWLREVDWLTFDDLCRHWWYQEEEMIEFGRQVNYIELETWDLPDMWEWQSQAKARLALGSVGLFDDRGMGKTRVVVEAIRDSQRFVEGRSVIVTSKRLRHVWEAAVEAWWAPGRSVSPHARVWSEAVDQIGSAPITIVTYESLQNEDIHSALCSMNIHWLVLEEAHNLKKRHTYNEKKNPNDEKIRTDTKSGLVRSVPSVHRVAVTGTPMPQRWYEIWTLLNFVAPNVFTSFWQFVEGIGDVTVNFWGGKEISHEILRPEIWDAIFDRWIILRDRNHSRRTIWDFVPVELTKEEKKAYRQMQTQMRAEKENGEVLDAPNVLAQATRLQQLAGGLGTWSTSEDDAGRVRSEYTPADPSSKVDTLIDMLAGLDRAVVFTRFRKRAEYVARRIGEDLPGVEPLLITGSTTEISTKLALARFSDPKQGPFVAICVFGTISEGVNELVAAQDIFFLDWSTTKDVSQAADRLDRPGQKGMVRAVTLYSKGTIDELTIDREAFKMVPIREALKTPDAWSFLLDPIDS